MQKNRITSKTTGNALEKISSVQLFRARKKGGPWARGALHARGFAPVEPPGLQASPWHPQRLPGPLGPGRPGSTYVLCSPGSFEGLSMPATPSPPNPHNHFVLAALRLENAISYLLCVCCTQGCKKEDPQTQCCGNNFMRGRLQDPLFSCEKSSSRELVFNVFLVFCFVFL